MNSGRWCQCTQMGSTPLQGGQGGVPRLPKTAVDYPQHGLTQPEPIKAMQAVRSHHRRRSVLARSLQGCDLNSRLLRPVAVK